MSSLSRVVWSEGMYLGPHHFQKQNRYFEELFQFAISSLHFCPYGFTECALDASALRNGDLVVAYARGMLPDGLVFDFARPEDCPAALPIRDEFPPDAQSITIRLGVPAFIPDGVNCLLNGTDGLETEWSRYTAEKRTIIDETTGKHGQAIPLARSDLRLFVDSGDYTNVVSVPIARVVRDGSGHFAFDRAFVPPCQRIGASEPLVSLLDGLLSKLKQKATDLSTARESNRSVLDFAAGDIARFWLLHAVNEGIASLRHTLDKNAHPEEAFRVLSRLGGALCTFASDSHPRSLPVYDHEDLGHCFTDLDRHVRRHLDLLLPENCIAVTLQAGAKYFYEAALPDTRVFGRARWILAAHSRNREAELLRLQKLAKVCSAQFVPELVKRGLPGMPLQHLTSPPASVSPRMETQYFDIQKGGPCWDHLVKTRRIGVYVPGEIPDPELQLLVVLDSVEEA
jgi:type VI secretion system protein ImpJ